MEKQILVAGEVADLLRVDKQRIYEMCRKNQLPGVIRLGERQYRFSARAIEQFLHGNNFEEETEVKIVK
jgi:excisionase family DNA binding protein